MVSCSFCSLVVSMTFLVVSLALTLTSILTDYWFLVGTEGIVTIEEQRAGNYNFGFWRQCYDDPPKTIPDSDLGGTDNKCIMIHERLIEKMPENITHNGEVVIHLSRSYICLAILSGVAQLATIIILLCGSWPGEGCQKMRKPPLYISAVVVLLIAICAGITSGICFIAARDIEEKELLMYYQKSSEYGWSFMLAWIATGVCLINGFLLMCMVKFAYDDVGLDSKYYYAS